MIARLPSFTICFEQSHFEFYSAGFDLVFFVSLHYGTVELGDVGAAGFSGVPFEYNKIASGISDRSVNALSNHVDDAHATAHLKLPPPRGVR
jgi:hypothetical protein